MNNGGQPRVQRAREEEATTSRSDCGPGRAGTPFVLENYVNGLPLVMFVEVND